MAERKLTFAIFVAKAAGTLSKTILNKSGETISGRVLLKILPSAIKSLSKHKIVILVSGTNGKTSTSRALSNQISKLGVLSTGKSGSNLIYGAASVLMHNSKYAVLEVDELHLPKLIVETSPKLVLLLNLSRDQLHRMHEVKKVAGRWHQVITDLPDTTFVIDVDDPFLNFATSNASSVVKVSFGGRRHPDASVCPSCGRYLKWQSGMYSCDCGITNSFPDFHFDPGSAAYRNLKLSNLCGELLGAPQSLTDIKQLERSETQTIESSSVELRLTKNPASWSEALESVKTNNVLIFLNAQQVDGIDTSWLWDVSFEHIRDKSIVVTGERALDMVYRLHVAGIESTMAPDFKSAVRSFPAGSDIYALASYTAYFDLVRN